MNYSAARLGTSNVFFGRSVTIKVQAYDRPERDLEAPWALVIATFKDHRCAPDQFPAPINDKGLKSKPRDLWLCPIWDPAGVDALFQPRGA
jgi:hypothetical protein